MIDATVMQDYIRDANPIPHLDDLDPDELARSVAAVQARRAALMQTPTQQPTRTEPTRSRRRTGVWAFAAGFIIILVVVGAAALLLTDGGATPVNEPASTTVIETPTTLPEAPPPTVAIDDAGSWAVTRLTEEWTGSIADVASLPSGGFVVVTQDPGRVLWSPDGVEWSDADPKRRVTAAAPTFWIEDPSEFISVMGDRVVILDGIEPGLWVGDVQAGAWESIPFDTADLAGQVEALAVASNDAEVLVLARHRDATTPELDEPSSISAKTEYLTWLTNLDTGEIGRHPLPIAFPTYWEEADWEDYGVVARLHDRWVVALGDTILVSPDGAAWTQVPDEDSFDTPLWVNSLAAGPTGVVASTCEGWGHHYVWFSEDGLKWDNTYVEAGHVEPLYSEALGFLVLLDESGQVTMSPDGRTWHTVEVDPSWRYRAPDGDLDSFAGNFQNLAVSGHTVFVDHDGGAFLLTYE